jgi:hypothetical protein
MNQSGWIVGALLAAFIVFLAIEGRLAAYWALLTGGAGASSSAPAPAAEAPLSPAQQLDKWIGIPNLF